MSKPIDEILAICLDQMEAGASLESCLADYPEQTEELRALLQMTQQFGELTNVGPRPAFAQAARGKLEHQLRVAPKAVTIHERNRLPRQGPNFFVQRRLSMSMLQGILAAVVALAATGGGAAYAANASHPGDLLHGLDLAMENAQLNLTPDVWSKVQLRLEFASERLTEAQTTFAEDKTDDGVEALNEYGTEISSAAQLVEGAGGADQEALSLLLETAQGIHEVVLSGLLAKVPEQAKESIQKTLEASHGRPSDAEAASSDATTSEEISTPAATDVPQEVTAPGVDISACAASLSKETAQALVELAKQHGVDRDYVLESFCAAGTLERVEEMLSTLPARPTDVPAGPPSDVPGASHTDHSGGQPTDVPHGPPSDKPGNPPSNPPGKP